MSGDLEKLKKALREEKYSEMKSSSKDQEKKVNKPSEIAENRTEVANKPSEILENRTDVLIFLIFISSIFFAFLVFLKSYN